MRNDDSPPRPPLSDEEIQDRIARGLDRGAAVAMEAISRRAGLLAVETGALKREIERTRKRLGVAGKHRLEKLAARLEGLRADAAAAELEAGLALARGGLAAFPARQAGAYGRVTDEAKHGQAGLAIDIVTAEGKSVATTRTDVGGYFSISAPDGVEGELRLQVATEPALRTFRLTSEGQPLSMRRLLIETAMHKAARTKGPPTTQPPKTQTETKTETKPATEKPTTSNQR